MIESADDGAFGGEVLAEFGEELIAALERGAEGGLGEVGGLSGEDGDFKLDGLNGLLHAAHGIGRLVLLAEGDVGLPAIVGVSLLLDQLRLFEREDN